jgi:hypothetical protein
MCKDRRRLLDAITGSMPTAKAPQRMTLALPRRQP